ncbi:hypothetical protein EJ02DRAFT_417558 [Clathrospora elynae]|uniref:Uncharacterized protein n=1 Tax=Clathrospora elynae TaxID=706981 RepID=A0A6A5SDP5_9PLEO|nr:hypothetical protein EJ02DRAFT_427363 [Clathrospora elynae]KAF1947369.1 hypothetical protein EJ02DRAFT_417558 [Clathrospora elynae]
MDASQTVAKQSQILVLPDDLNDEVTSDTDDFDTPSVGRNYANLFTAVWSHQPSPRVNSELMAGLLDLALELREEIYILCIAQHGGFVYEPHKRKLRTAEEGFFNVSLMRTCKQVACESNDASIF